jgi:hypothetical protein
MFQVSVIRRVTRGILGQNLITRRRRRLSSLLPQIVSFKKLPSIAFKEVPNINLFYHLCETTAAFVRDVLKLKVVTVSPGELTLEMAFTPELAGNPSPVTMHGGVIAAAIDHAAGFGCWTTFDTSICSTLNMRIDYLKPLFLEDKSKSTTTTSNSDIFCCPPRRPFSSQ